LQRCTVLGEAVFLKRFDSFYLFKTISAGKLQKDSMIIRLLWLSSEEKILLFGAFPVKLSGYEKNRNQVYWRLETFVKVTGINGKEQEKQAGVMVGR